MAGIDLATAKRSKNKTKEQVEFTGINSPMYLEKQMAKFNTFMVKEIRKRFENKVLKKMNKGTVEKFQDSKENVLVSHMETIVYHDSMDNFNNRIPSHKTRITKTPYAIKDLDTAFIIHHRILDIEFQDAQEGNYAVIYNKLFNEFKKSVDKQFSPARIEKFVKQLFNKADSYNQGRFYSNVNNTMGIDLDAVLKTDGLNSFVNAKTLQSTDQLEKLKSDTLVAYKTNVLRRMSAGDSLTSLYQEVKKQTGLRLKNGDLIARNELKSFNSELSNKRAENNGITKSYLENCKR